MILRDPVHGLISFGGARERLLTALMNAREVQRLRRIRALGLASLAFPGGEHSRFAHAVGSAYVMRRYLERAWELSHELAAADRIDSGTELVALAAALLHDLGHGPLSHTFETLIPGALAHERWTSRIIEDPDSEVHRILRELDPEAPRAVERLVHGEHEIAHLARAVSGTFDVDRCDYLLRDSHMTGVRYGTLDLAWLLQSLRLREHEDRPGATLLVDGEKGLTAVEGFFLARLHMYRQVYLHKAVRCAEVMVRALFARLLERGPAPGTPPALASLLRREPLRVSGYQSLDDPSLEMALAAYEGGSDPVLARLAAGLRHRRLFKSLALQPGDDEGEVLAALRELVAEQGLDPRYFVGVDRVEVSAYDEDEALTVLHADGSTSPLLAASPLLRGLAAENFVARRVMFPAEVRERAQGALAALRGRRGAPG